MIAEKTWTLNRERLAKALADWESTDPDKASRDEVDDRLMDIVKDPLHVGAEDPDSPGIFFARTVKANVGILFTIIDYEIFIARIMTAT